MLDRIPPGPSPPLTSLPSWCKQGCVQVADLAKPDPGGLMTREHPLSLALVIADWL